MKDKDQDLMKKVDIWWDKLRYLQKLDILLESNPGYDITNVERKGVKNLWNGNSPKRKALIMEIYEKERSARVRK